MQYGDVVGSGVTFGAELLAYTDAVMAPAAPAISRTRAAIAHLLSAADVAQVADVVAMFNMADRVADATGIPIDAGSTYDMRYAVGTELRMDQRAPEKRI